jgi:hypothetical protein
MATAHGCPPAHRSTGIAEKPGKGRLLKDSSPGTPGRVSGIRLTIRDELVLCVTVYFVRIEAVNTPLI